jgi:peroxiredoxin
MGLIIRNRFSLLLLIVIVVVPAMTLGRYYGRFFMAGGFQPKPGQMLPSFSLPNIHNRSVSVHDYFPQNSLLLVFTKSDCGHCSGELSTLGTLDEDCTRGLKVVVIIEAPENSPKPMARYNEQSASRFETLIDHEGVLRKQFGGGPVPVMIFVDRNGLIRHVLRGERSKEFLQAFITLFLRQARL